LASTTPDCNRMCVLGVHSLTCSHAGGTAPMTQLFDQRRNGGTTPASRLQCMQRSQKANQETT
jgi:hypothetical protein